MASAARRVLETGLTQHGDLSLSEGDERLLLQVTVSPVRNAAGTARDCLMQEFGHARALVVDDDQANCEIALEMLCAAGLSADAVHDGNDAVQRTAAQNYDLILMDMQMPVLDGMAATRQLRLNPQTRSVRIIAMTANAFEGHRQQCLDAGMIDFPSKRFTDLQVVYGCLLQHLRSASWPSTAKSDARRT